MIKVKYLRRNLNRMDCTIRKALTWLTQRNKRIVCYLESVFKIIYAFHSLNVMCYFRHYPLVIKTKIVLIKTETFEYFHQYSHIRQISVRTVSIKIEFLLIININITKRLWLIDWLTIVRCKGGLFLICIDWSMKE